MRGALNSLYDPSYNLGVIISFFMGNYLSWLDQAKTQLIVPIIFIIVLFLLPESPEFWAKKNKEKVSRRSNYSLDKFIYSSNPYLLPYHFVYHSRKR